MASMVSAAPCMQELVQVKRGERRRCGCGWIWAARRGGGIRASGRGLERELRGVSRLGVGAEAIERPRGERRRAAVPPTGSEPYDL